MKYDPTIKRRQSIRLKGYDYTSAGAYFITICTHCHLYLFGKIGDGEMQLNDVGKIVAVEWLQTAAIRNEIELDEWVVMPNHFHGILFIRSDKGTARRAPTPITTFFTTLQPASNSRIVGRVFQKR
jgi:REP element-mobilizing transposase RayT